MKFGKNLVLNVFIYAVGFLPTSLSPSSGLVFLRELLIIWDFLCDSTSQNLYEEMSEYICDLPKSH